MTEQPNTRYIFSIRTTGNDWTFEAPSYHGFEEIVTHKRAMDFFEMLREGGRVDVRAEKIEGETISDVSNDLEEAIWQAEQDERREAAEDAAHERAESASWRYI